MYLGLCCFRNRMSTLPSQKLAQFCRARHAKKSAHCAATSHSRYSDTCRDVTTFSLTTLTLSITYIRPRSSRNRNAIWCKTRIQMIMK